MIWDMVSRPATEMEKSTKSFETASLELERLGDEIGVKIKCQREEIFTSMHRI